MQPSGRGVATRIIIEDLFGNEYTRNLKAKIRR
jgi:hypothetical protein